MKNVGFEIMSNIKRKESERENDKCRKSNGSRSKKKLINVKLCCFGRR